MSVVKLVLLSLAVALFLMAALDVKLARVQLCPLALGLAMLALAMLLGAARS